MYLAAIASAYVRAGAEGYLHVIIIQAGAFVEGDLIKATAVAKFDAGFDTKFYCKLYVDATFNAIVISGGFYLRYLTI